MNAGTFIRQSVRLATVAGIAGSLLLILLCIFLLSTAQAQADGNFLRVPDDYPTIQAAIDAAQAGAEIAASIARHGVKVTAVPEHSAGVPVSAVIANRVADNGFDLVIMGAYSHARITEFLFGGVTRSILSGMPALTLMSR